MAEGGRVGSDCDLDNIQVVETGKECLSGGYIDLTDTVSPAVDVSISIFRVLAHARTILCLHAPQSVVAGLQSTAIFEQLKEHLSSSPDIVKKVKAIFMWNITKDGKTVAKWSKILMHCLTPPQTDSFLEPPKSLICQQLHNMPVTMDIRVDTMFWL